MNKRTVIVTLVAVVLVILLFLFEHPFQGRHTTPPRKEERVQLVTPLGEDEISRIEISSGIGTSITLVRKNRKWFTRGGYKADPVAVRRLIEGLSEIKNPELISINPDAHMKFQVHPLVGKRIRVFDMSGKPRTDIIVGQLQRDFFSVPVRKPDSNNVYRVRSSLRSVLSRSSWRDRNIFRLQQESIQAISVVAPDEHYTLVRNPGAGWAFSEPTSAPADNQQVQNLLASVANLASSDFVRRTEDPDDLTTYGLLDPYSTLTVQLDDGSSVCAIFGSETVEGAQTKYYAKRTDDPQVYKVYEQTYNRVIRKSITLKPKPKPAKTPPPPPPPRPVTTGTATVTTPSKPAEAPSSPTAKLKPAKEKPPPPANSSTTASAKTRK